MRSGAKVAVIGGVFIVFAGGAAYGAYNVLLGGGSGGTSQAAPKRTGPPSAEEIRTTAKDFLAAWAGGDAGTAAQLTNNAVEAEPVLAGYAEDAHISEAKLTPGQPVGAKVPFTVSAVVSYEGQRKPLSYRSELTVVRGLTTGRPLVDWQPTVIHPELGKGETLKTAQAAVPPIEAVDRNGKKLTEEKYPSLGPVLDELRKRYGDKAGGKAGVELVIDSGLAEGTDRTLLTLTEGEPGELRTTLDAKVQAAAEKTVMTYDESSVVAIQPSTGEVRAVANNRKGRWNAAFLGKQAPGSTMKIVTAALLLEKGLVAADRTAECPKDVMYQGATFHNLDNFSIEGAPFSTSFARSCNTAFIKLIDDTKDEAALSKEAQDVFGIGLDWQTGIPSVDGSVPQETGGEAAAQYIGQGTIQMNALNMASITATAKSGTFKQPVIVPLSLDDRQPATASRSLPGSVAKQLRNLMRLTATAAYGTGTQAMATVGGDKGAKTGSAEVDGNATSNSWFTGFSDDLAAAAVVDSGGHGSDAAGPLVAAVLNAG
ncbi:penicillin-binding transpeptidase domain-containing protein [Streptomyces sp. FIT100]|uniref:penicillin-binding transpeptidase domain-containing protein n=1 Tax=Streptomyces sp. FIT100 TaxID=2837956 RepID=UPI0021C9502F|nr:penicillin-binding transpeptidase domain-containing protein [Streptomyces sp. FIT100]UUN27355.1 penicillin-binding protein [Streptomyces sp. FIT100]